MRILATLFFLTGFALFAQEAAPANVTNDGSHPDPQVSKTIEETEKSLNEIIKEQNKILKIHTRLLKVRVEVLPTKTFIYKGVPSDDGEDCNYLDKDGKILPQESDTNTCLKLVIFDFEKSEEGKSELSLGSRSKYISVFFDKGATEKDPKKVPRAEKIVKIISKIRSEQFKEEDLKVSYVIDEDPSQVETSVSAHNDVLKVFYQHDGLPFRVENKMPEEQVNRKGYGVYKLSSMDNTITNPYRNEFKQTYYVKHLDKFNKLFTAIYDMNEAHGVKRYKESNQILKNSLAY